MGIVLIAAQDVWAGAVLSQCLWPSRRHRRGFCHELRMHVLAVPHLLHVLAVPHLLRALAMPHVLRVLVARHLLHVLVVPHLRANSHVCTPAPEAARAFDALGTPVAGAAPLQHLVAPRRTRLAASLRNSWLVLATWT